MGRYAEATDEPDAIERVAKEHNVPANKLDSDGAVMSLSAEQRRALELLASIPVGLTAATLLAHGFWNEMLAEFVTAGLATVVAETIGPAIKSSATASLTTAGAP